MTATLAQRQAALGRYLMQGNSKLGIPGLPMASACAVVGNATEENLCFPVTSGPKDHGSDGMMQWRLGRLDDMHNYCVKNFGRWDTLEAQAAFFMYECKRDYPAIYGWLLAGQKTIPTLTADICDYYERPSAALARFNDRLKYAEDAHAILAGVAPKKQSNAGTGVIVTTGAAVAASHFSGMPIWATMLIITAGIAVMIAVSIIKAKKPNAVPEPKK